MPNHVTSIIALDGTEDDTKGILHSLKSEETIFDFEKILPQPTYLENRQRNYKGSQNNLYKKIFGTDNWYDWRINNWGTKWNSYDCFEIDEQSIEIKTAWSTPERIIKELSEMYPNIEIHVKYADEDLGVNCGEYSYKAGDRTYFQDNSMYGGNDQETAIRWAMRVCYGDEDMYEEMYQEEIKEEKEEK